MWVFYNLIIRDTICNSYHNFLSEMHKGKNAIFSRHFLKEVTPFPSNPTADKSEVFKFVVPFFSPFEVKRAIECLQSQSSWISPNHT